LHNNANLPKWTAEQRQAHLEAVKNLVLDSPVISNPSPLTSNQGIAVAIPKGAEFKSYPSLR
jgi:hypothetical protein